MRTALLTLLMAVTLCAQPSIAADFKITAGDTFEQVIMGQKTKRITLRLRSGQEITGVVRECTPRMVQLGAIAGREFFDAVIPLEAIEAVVIRTRD